MLYYILHLTSFLQKQFSGNCSLEDIRKIKNQHSDIISSYIQQVGAKRFFSWNDWGPRRDERLCKKHMSLFDTFFLLLFICCHLGIMNPFVAHWPYFVIQILNLDTSVYFILDDKHYKCCVILLGKIYATIFMCKTT